MVVELGAVGKEVDRLKLEIERLIEVGRERQRGLKQLDDDVESIFERLGELESVEAKAAAAKVLERRLIALEDQEREAKAREVAKPEACAVEEVDERERHKTLESILERLKDLESGEARAAVRESHWQAIHDSDRKNHRFIKEVDKKRV